MATSFNRPSQSGSSNQDILTRTLSRIYPINWEAIIYLVIFLLAVFTRFYALGDRVMSHDESLHVRYSYNLFADGVYHHTPMMHGPILFHMTALNYFLFGDNDFTGRIYTSVLGVLMVMFPLLFRRWLGRWGAIVTSILLLISPIVMYYNRYIREDTPSIFFTMIMVYATLMYLNGPKHQLRRARWLYILAAAMLAGLASKESGFIYIAIFGSFLTLYWIVRLFQHFRKIPGKTVMNFVTVGILLGAVLALGMYNVLSIIRPESAIPGSLEAAMLFNWTGAIILFALVTITATALWAFRKSRVSVRPADIAILLVVVFIACGLFIVIEERSHIPQRSTELAEVAQVLDPDAEVVAVTGELSAFPIILAWTIAALVVAGVLISARRGWWRQLHRFPELDVMIVMATLVLPWATPLVIWVAGADPTDYSAEGIQRVIIALIPMASIMFTVGLVWNWRRWLIAFSVFHILFVFFFTTMFTNADGLATGMIGSLGYWLEQQGVRRGGQPQYYYLLVIMPFYEYLPIIGSVFAMFSGMTGFWHYRRKQQENKLALNDLNATTLTSGEEAPPLESLVENSDTIDAMIKQRVTLEKQIAKESKLREIPFLLFVSWWALFNAIGYTLAGEKMPWLAMHITVPMIFLSGWFFGKILDRLNWQKLTQRGWAYLLLFPLMFAIIYQLIAPFLFGTSPLANLQQQSQAQLFQWIGMLSALVLVILVIFMVRKMTGKRHMWHMLGLAILIAVGGLTFRHAWLFSFVNYDLATEFGVYAHSNPSVKWVLDDLEELSTRTTGSLNMKFIYDNDTSWPNSWYYRGFPRGQFVGDSFTPQNVDDAMAVVVGESNRSKVEPLLEDRYYHFEYIRMWWPMQDYFHLSAQRVANTFDFSGENFQAPQIRRGLFDMWWARDYTTYSDAVGSGESWTLDKWAVSNRMHFYVRKDIAAQVWNMGVGEGTAFNPLDTVEVNYCTSNWQVLSANLVFNTAQGDAFLNHPVGIMVDDDRVYVADEFNNRIAIFDTEGNYIESLGSLDPTSSLILNRPNSLVMGNDGNLYIADTWNYQVKVVDTEGNLIRYWGQPGQFGAEALTDPVDAFWGPRDIAIDSAGNIYVADTGNKRVRVYTSNGDYLRDIGSAGYEPGQLDEPSGVVIHPDGRVFVADTWNRRISVFNSDGTPNQQFRVRGWYDDLGNRPYLALDAERDMLYVTDPDAGRVLVYDTNGNCIGSFGQPTSQSPQANQFNIVGGITTDAEGNVYIVDMGSNRILRFAPFPKPAPVEDAPITDLSEEGETLLDGDANGFSDVIEPIQITEEVTDPETTEDSQGEVG